MGFIYMLGMFALVVFFLGIRIVRPTSRGLVERFGKYNRFAQPGFHWIIPVIDVMYQVNITEIMVDAERLTSVLAHLIRNAQDACDSDGQVQLEILHQGGSACLEIRDNGSGMDEEFIRHRLFKPFDTTKSGKGMGIGVYQTREYISSLGGSVNVDSILNEGTTFTISIPTNAI